MWVGVEWSGGRCTKQEGRWEEEGSGWSGEVGEKRGGGRKSRSGEGAMGESARR